jgi:hypothetical protein
MRLERIESLLRSQPPDEPPYRGELLLGPRIVPATRGPVRGQRPIAGALAGAVVVAVLVGLIVAVVGPFAAVPSNGPSPSTAVTGSPEASPPIGVISWIDATPPPPPTPEPTDDPRSLLACAAGDLVFEAQGWGGATGSQAGGASLFNISSNPCTVAGKPGIELLDSHGDVIATGRGPDASPGSPLVVLPTGASAGVITVWSNWCGNPPSRPLRIRLSLPGAGGELTAAVREDELTGPGSVPRCDSPGSGSTFGVPLDFEAPEPSSGGYQPEACGVDALAAYLGVWGAAAGTSYANLIVLNHGHVDCLFATSATIELRDANGHPVSVAASEPTAPVVLLPPGWAAIATIGYSDWCTPPPALPLRADVVIGSARLAVVPRGPIPVPFCMSAPETPPPGMFFEKPFVVPGSPAPPEPDPVDTLPIDVTISPLPPTPPGGTLEYTVTLTNVSAYEKTLNLAAFCPTYMERLFLPGAGAAIETHLALNCGPAGVLQPNGSVTFAMRLPIPADATPGTASLTWQLGARGPAAKVTFEIRP